MGLPKAYPENPCTSVLGSVNCTLIANSQDNWGGVIWGVILLGLCLWRCIVTITRRNKKHVSYFTIGLLSLLIIGLCFWPIA